MLEGKGMAQSWIVAVEMQTVREAENRRDRQKEKEKTVSTDEQSMKKRTKKFNPTGYQLLYFTF